MKLQASDRTNLGRVGSNECPHCGLTLEPSMLSGFCCVGCAIANKAIKQAGFEETYYSLRELNALAHGVPAKPSTASSSMSRHRLGSDAFVQKSTTELSNGDRQVCLAIDGLTCAACGWLAEQVVNSHTGMKDAEVNLPEATLRFDFDPARASLTDLLDSLERFGYALHPRKSRPAGASREEKRLLVKVGICWALAGNIMLLAFAMYSGLSLESDRELATAARWASLLIATFSVAYGGSVFFRTAFASIRIAMRKRSIRRLHVDTPISLGIIVGFSHSAYSTYAGTGAVWFDSIAVLIAALLTARWLQIRSQRTAAQATTRLLDMVPSTARLLSPDGSVSYVQSEDIVAGQTIRVDPDEIIPVDGVILSGRSTLNKAVITGESLPAAVEPGESVFAGSINQLSPLILKVESSGADTRVGRLLDWLEQSTKSTAPVVKLTDRISGYFVVGILATAIATSIVGVFLFPLSVVHRVVALLVISCPCALGMATPLAIAASNGKAARRGIFIKDGTTVEVLSKISTVVFDKTGTLTEGDLSIVNYYGTDESLRYAAVIEAHSNHPIAASFLKEAERRRHDLDAMPAATAVTIHPGCGLRGWVDGVEIIVGRPDWVVSESQSIGVPLREIDELAESGLTPVAISIDGVLEGLAGCGDKVRANSAAEVRRLHDRGVDVLLLSGDHHGVVSAVARKVGIPDANALGDIGPENKQRLVELLSRDQRVMMVGDGANDAIALRTADVGVAVGNENAPCLVASDIWVPNAGGPAVDQLLRFGDNVLALIRRNLGISLAYNVIAGSAAVLGFVTPLVAAIAMPLSSLFVVSTSMAVDPFGYRSKAPNSTRPAETLDNQRSRDSRWMDNTNTSKANAE